MQNIIGLGEAGVNIAKVFSQYPQYNVYTIDSEKSDVPNHFLFPRCKTHEEYENATPQLGGFFKDISEGEDTLFIVGGAGKISGASLAILHQLSHAKVHLLYVQPDISLLSGSKSMQERVVYNVLQQYARSGKFERIILVSNPELEKIIGGAPIIGYYDKLNKILVSSMHMINVYDHGTPVMSTLSKPLEVSKITTLGVLDLEKKEEKLFFPLTAVREKGYYYAMNHEVLSTDTELYKKITEQMKERVTEEKIKVSYSVYSTQYKQNYGFLIARSSMVQGTDIKEE